LTAAAAAVDRAERRASYRRVVLSRTFLLLLLAGYPLYALVSVIFSWLPSYLQVGLNFSPLTSGFLFGLPSVVVLAFMLIAGWVTDRLLAAGVSSRVARGLVPTLSLVLGGLLLAMLPLAGTERYLAYALLVGGYSLTVLALPIIYAAIGTAAAPGQRTSVLSLFIGLQSTSGIVAPWATGLLRNASRRFSKSLISVMSRGMPVCCLCCSIAPRSLNSWYCNLILSSARNASTRWRIVWKSSCSMIAWQSSLVFSRMTEFSEFFSI